MPSTRDKHRRAGRRGVIALVLALVALLAVSSSAFAGQDVLKGGSAVLQLQGSRGLKLKPSSLTLPITSGAVDPVDGSGTAQVSGAFRVKRGKHKAKVSLTAFSLGANGGPGSIVAKVGKDFVSGFGTLSGGTVTRDGWGARIENVTATIARSGARALNRALSPRKKGARKSARGGVKAGQPLGKIVSLTTDPQSVELVPGTGSMELVTNLGGAFAGKLPQHCISLLGVTAIAPAMMELLPVGGFTFPVAGGSAAPDFSAGDLFTAGGQTLTKDNGLGTPGGCSNGPPVGTHLLSTELGVAFALNNLTAIATLPDGTTLLNGQQVHRSGHQDADGHRRHGQSRGPCCAAPQPGLPHGIGQRQRRLRGRRSDRHDQHHRGEAALSGGGGIRTPEGPKAPNGFQGRRIQPLCHPSG
jgi:hypothetical protein